MECRRYSARGSWFDSNHIHQSSDTAEIFNQIANDKASVRTVLITSLLEFTDRCQL